MNIKKSLLSLMLAGVLTAGVSKSILFATCDLPQQGKIIELEISSCTEITADGSRDVMEFAGKKNSKLNYKKFYTGALVTDNKGFRWMYPSKSSRPCEDFPRKATVKKKASYTCCEDTRAGKCVFGGQWLADVKAKAVDASQ